MNRFIRLLAVLALASVWAPPAHAQNAFEIPGVHVQASGTSASEARSRAIAGGRPTAWQMLFRRLTRAQDWARCPVLDDAQLQKIIIGYSPINERRSTTRYMADVTYTFNPEAVARLLQASGIPYTAAPTRRILVIPMAPGYSRNSTWTQAFANPRFAGSYVPFTVPYGDATDMASLQSLVFETAKWNDIAPVAARLHASEAVLVKAEEAGNKLALSLMRLGAGELPYKTGFEVPLIQGAPSTYPAAADAVVRAVEEMWKTQKALDYSQKGKLTADVRIGSLAQFAALENALAGVPNVASVDVVAMDIGQARLAITYMGSTEQLRNALAQAGITLVNNGGTWQISPSTAGPP